MKYVFVSLIACTILMASCSSEGERSQEEIKTDISDKEAQLAKLSEKIKSMDELDSANTQLLDVLLEYYHTYPDDEYAANCLSKVHMVHSRSGEYNLAAAYADTLLQKYPKFVDRSQMIESQIQAYEMLIKPRNVEKIKKYLQLWLKENKNAPKEKIEDMQYHLKYVDMSLEDRMRQNMQELN